MKSTITIFTFLLLVNCPFFAQVDEVSVGIGYSQQAYYNMTTGDVQTLENDSWDIAFSAAGFQDAGVFINESITFMSTPVQVYLAETTDWDEVITNTDGYVDSVALYNPKENWTAGAMNSIKDPNSGLDYGWGAYNPQTHQIEGNKIFVIKKRNGAFIKLQITSLAGGEYNFRYANLDGTNEETATVSKDDTEAPLIYYSFETNSTIESPTAYDLIFQRYSTPLDDGEGGIINYTVTGVLLAPDVEAVVADGVDIGNVNESDYAEHYSSLPTTIGHDWKAFDFQAGWVIDLDRTHFVKTAEGEIYQLTFFDFEGSGTGNITLDKIYVTTVSASEIEIDDPSIKIFPNPTSDFVTFDTDEMDDVQVKIFDIRGQELNSFSTKSNTPVDMRNLKPGLYMLSVERDDRWTTSRLVVR